MAILSHKCVMPLDVLLEEPDDYGGDYPIRLAVQEDLDDESSWEEAWQRWIDHGEPVG